MNEDERNNRGRFMECEREPWREVFVEAAQAWADDIDRRAFDHAWGVLFGARAANESRVRSGRERLGE